MRVRCSPRLRAFSDLSGQLIDRSGFRTPAEIIREAGGTDKYLQRRREAGISTPFPTLNRMTGGFRPGDSVAIAAQTGHGKTAMAIDVQCASPAQVSPRRCSLR